MIFVTHYPQVALLLEDKDVAEKACCCHMSYMENEDLKTITFLYQIVGGF